MTTIIEINDALWNNASDDEKNQVTTLLKKCKLLSGDGSIIGNASIPAPTNELFGLDGWWCGMVCDTTAEAAKLAAQASLGGVALDAALAIIEKARNVCHSAC